MAGRRIQIEINGTTLAFTSVRQARRFHEKLGQVIEEEAGRESFAEAHLSKDEVATLMHRATALGAAQLAGKVWSRLMYMAHADRLINFVCANCANYIHECDPQNARCCKRWIRDRAMLETQSLLRNSEAVVEYEGPHIGNSVREGFRILIEAIENGDA